MYLLDTNVISEVHRKKASPNVVAFFEKSRRENLPLFISTLTLGEIRKGALKTNDKVHSKRILELLEEIEIDLEGMILPITDEISHEWGRLMAIDSTNPVDALFAATASVHDLIVATRNEKHFKPLGVDYLNPFSE